MRRKEGKNFTPGTRYSGVMDRAAMDLEPVTTVGRSAASRASCSAPKLAYLCLANWCVLGRCGTIAVALRFLRQGDGWWRCTDGLGVGIWDWQETCRSMWETLSWPVRECNKSKGGTAPNCTKTTGMENGKVGVSPTRLFRLTWVCLRWERLFMIGH